MGRRGRTFRTPPRPLLAHLPFVLQRGRTAAFALLPGRGDLRHSREDRDFDSGVHAGQQRRQDIVPAVTEVNSGAGVVVLTDMFGGTPSNLAISIMNGSNIEIIAAVNLPMLIKLASVRETSNLEQAVIQAQDAGRRYICAASRVLGAKPDRVDMPFDQVA